MFFASVIFSDLSVKTLGPKNVFFFGPSVLTLRPEKVTGAKNNAETNVFRAQLETIGCLKIASFTKKWHWFNCTRSRGCEHMTAFLFEQKNDSLNKMLRTSVFVRTQNALIYRGQNM